MGTPVQHEQTREGELTRFQRFLRAWSRRNPAPPEVLLSLSFLSRQGTGSEKEAFLYEASLFLGRSPCTSSPHGLVYRKYDTNVDTPRVQAQTT